MRRIFSHILGRGFDVSFTYHAAAILSRDFPDAVRELDSIVGDVTVPMEEIVRGGGGEARVTQRLRNALEQEGWRKKSFQIETRINDRTTESQSHEVDHVKTFKKGTIVLEIEWNNKDPFFDRDLENFNRLHANGGISVGVIVTRGASLQDGIELRIRNFADSQRFTSFIDLESFDLEPTTRQKREVERYMRANECGFAQAWATCFTRDKFGTATTHWTKLKSRLDRGVGSPCPIVAIGIPLKCISD